MLRIDQTGLWNWCEGYYLLDQDWQARVTYCGSSSNEYFFDPIGLMASELLPPYAITFVQSEVDAIDLVHRTAAWLRAAYTIGISLTGIACCMIPVAIAWPERKQLAYLPGCTMLLVALVLSVGSVTVTSVYERLGDAFSTDDHLSVEAHLSKQTFAFVWLSMVTAWTAGGQWCCVAMFCPGGRCRVDRLSLSIW